MRLRKPRVGGTALITGASAGIGAELAKIFGEHKHDVILVARRQDALEALAGQIEGRSGVRVSVFPADLAEPGAPAELFEAIRGAELDVDILVNNAGFGLGGEFTETDLDTELRMIQVNITALTYLTKLFLPAMVQRRSGGILNVASTAAFQPGPLMSVYYATKAYVLSFTEAIAEELRDSGVTVTALCPGPTATEFAEIAHVAQSRLFALAVGDARSVAKVGYNSLQRGVRVAIPGAQNKLMAQARRFAPRGVVTRVVRLIQERR